MAGELLPVERNELLVYLIELVRIWKTIDRNSALSNQLGCDVNPRATAIAYLSPIINVKE